MKKIISILSFCAISLFANNTEFNKLNNKVVPLNTSLIENNFYGNWEIKSLDSEDNKTYFYNESDKNNIQLYFSNIREKVLINQKDLKIIFFIVSNRIYIGEPKTKVGSPGLVNSEEYKILGSLNNDNKLCYLLEVKSSIFDSTKNSLLCKK